MTVGKKIKKRREELGLSQDELAKKVGYASRSSIQKIEAARDLPLKKVEKMAEALDLSVAYLMDWEEFNLNPVIESINKYHRKQMSNSKAYYLDDEAQEAAQFLYENPEYKVLFDATRKVKKEDIEFVKQMIDKLSN